MLGFVCLFTKPNIESKQSLINNKPQTTNNQQHPIQLSFTQLDSQLDLYIRKLSRLKLHPDLICLEAEFFHQLF